MKLETVDKNITVQSSSIDLGSSLPNHAREAILRVASKYFGRLNTASVHVNREGITYRCSVNMQMGALPMKSAEARDKDIYVAFNLALNKVAKQLRRTKREVREDKGDPAIKQNVARGALRNRRNDDPGPET
jgi:ribosomal subunit interface protein